MRWKTQVGSHGAGGGFGRVDDGEWVTEGGQGAADGGLD